jgi:hypothetical protein
LQDFDINPLLAGDGHSLCSIAHWYVQYFCTEEFLPASKFKPQPAHVFNLDLALQGLQRGADVRVDTTFPHVMHAFRRDILVCTFSSRDARSPAPGDTGLL